MLSSLDPMQQWQATVALRNLSVTNAVNVATAGALPGLFALLRTCRDHGVTTASDMHNAIIEAIGSFAKHAADWDDDSINSLIELLGPGSSSGEQEMATGALNNLAYSHADNKVKITSAGAIPLLVTLLGPQNSAKVQEGVAGTLSELAAGDADNQVKIADAGAIPPLTTLLGPQISARVQEKAIWALSNLAADNTDNQVKISVVGGFTALIHISQHHPSMKVKEAASKALEMLPYPAVSYDEMIIAISFAGRYEYAHTLTHTST